MVFPTIDFAIFFGVVYVGAWLLAPRPVLWKLWILAASYYFYAYAQWDWVFLLLASTAIAHLSAELVATRRTQWAKRLWMIVGVSGLLGLLGYFKYYAFVAVNVDNAASNVNLGVLGGIFLWASPAILAGIAIWAARRLLVGRDHKASNAWFVAACAALGLLAVYVVFNGSFRSWVASGQHASLGDVLPLWSVGLPIAISFFTFMGISYVIDVYRGTIQPYKALDVAVYLSFFPHLVSGPIVRGNELLPQLRQRRDARDVDFPRACAMIMSGLFKKIVISDYLFTITNPVFSAPNNRSALDVLIAVWAYSIEIYVDFSGYTDIAIGVAALLGIRFPVNFDAPYTARSLQDFWRRWHITLSRWLRDYLYIPLGGSREGMSMTARNIMITMILGGLWHGANWTFLVWGGLHGVGQVVGHLKRSARVRAGLAPESDAWWAKVWQRFFVFQYVSLAWLFFNASSMSNAFALLGRLVHGWSTPSTIVTPLVVAVIAGSIAVQYIPRDAIDRAIVVFGRLAAPVQAAALGLGLLVTTTLGQTGVQPFIYYRF